MRVLIVNPVFYAYGGAERVIVRLANYLTDHGHPNTLVTTRILPKIKAEFKETRIIETQTLETIIPVVHSLLSNFDVVNLHNDPAEITIYPRHHPSVWLCNEPPIQVLEGGELDEKTKQIVRNHIDICVVADEYNRQRFQRLFGVDARVNPYGVDFEFFAKGDGAGAREKWGLGDDFVILQVGMLTFTKNQLKTISIFKDVKKRVPGAKLVLAGFNKTTYYEGVKNRIMTSRLNRDVIVTGEVSQEELRDLYHACDVVVAPIMPQGGWLSTFEAMAAGKPVVVSPEMTAASILKENGIGFVADDFVETVVGLHELPVCDFAGRKWVRDNLSWDRFCGNMLGYFEEAAA